ncbi:MAG: tRNA dihydrouridine synthase DusB [Clostridia bacterium]|nr:tRNA dihydrouridine synthase DusB [Clostridia bacterium]
MKIGNVIIEGYAALAPMAGVSDRAMREICVDLGAAFTVGELTSAKAVVLGDDKSKALLKSVGGRIWAPQLFGSDPGIMARAAQKAEEYSPSFIDINMGCPAPKVAGNGGGSALLRDIPLAARIIRAVADAVRLPVTVKIRTGWDSAHITAVELAKAAEQAGAAAITVHGRTRDQMYAPPVDIKTIAAVKAAVGIPIIANGDINSGISAKNMYDNTGCDFVAVGRAARGNPFVFSEINAYMEGKKYTPPKLKERLDTCLLQIEKMLSYKDPYIAMLEARKHVAWYMTGLSGAAELRRMACGIKSLADVDKIIEKALEQNPDM